MSQLFTVLPVALHVLAVVYQINTFFNLQVSLELSIVGT